MSELVKRISKDMTKFSKYFPYDILRGETTFKNCDGWRYVTYPCPIKGTDWPNICFKGVLFARDTVEHPIPPSTQIKQYVGIKIGKMLIFNLNK